MTRTGLLNGGHTQAPRSNSSGGVPPVPEIVRHLAVALATHVRKLRNDGLTVPAEVGQLAAFLTRSVRVRPEPTAVDEHMGAANDGLVVGRLLVTKAEAAKRLSVSVRTIERLVAAGRLPLVHVERSARLRVIDLEAFVRNLHTDLAPRDDRVLPGGDGAAATSGGSEEIRHNRDGSAREGVPVY